DLAVEEGDGDLVAVVVERQDTGLLLDAYELEDVGETEVLEGSFKRHGPTPAPYGATRPCFPRSTARSSASRRSRHRAAADPRRAPAERAAAARAGADR